MVTHDKMIVGSAEWCAFPTLGIPAIKARVDSGAKTSSIHAFNIEKFEKNGKFWVRFDVHPLQNDRQTTIHCERPLLGRRNVKNTSGITETRYVISVPLQLGDNTWDIELTLSNRDAMGHRMLLGREAMIDRILVDPSASYYLGEVSDEDLLTHYGDIAPPKKGLKIGLLASNPDLYSNIRIMQAGTDCGHDMRFIDIAQCYMKLDAQSPEVHYRGGEALNDFDAVITRIRPSMTFYGCAVTRQFESMGVYTTNESAAILQSRDKLYSLQVMIKNGIHTPVTGFANSPIDTKNLIDMVEGAPLIVKLLQGTQGRGVVLAETKKAAESVISAFKSLHANLLVQKFIKEADGKDLRCFVIDGKVVGAMERTAAPGEFRANLHRGGTASNVKITREERRMAIKAAKTLGLSVAGVDIIRAKDGPLILEVNSSPGLEGVENATGNDIAGMMISSIEKKLCWKGPTASK